MLSELAYREAKVQFIVVHEEEARVWSHLLTKIRWSFAKETRKQLPSWRASKMSTPEMSCLWIDSHPLSLIIAWGRKKRRTCKSLKKKEEKTLDIGWTIGRKRLYGTYLMLAAEQCRRESKESRLQTNSTRLSQRSTNGSLTLRSESSMMKRKQLRWASRQVWSAIHKVLKLCANNVFSKKLKALKAKQGRESHWSLTR